jgi:hypothetical protein
MASAPGWYKDPAGGPGERRWDGWRRTSAMRAAPLDGGSHAKPRRCWLRPVLIAAPIVVGLLALIGIGGCASDLAWIHRRGTGGALAAGAVG